MRDIDECIASVGANSAALLRILKPLLDVAIEGLSRENALLQPRAAEYRQNQDMANAMASLAPTLEAASSLLAIMQEVLSNPAMIAEEIDKAYQSQRNVLVGRFSSEPAYLALDEVAMAAASKNQSECRAAIRSIDRHSIDRRFLLSVALLCHAEACAGELRAEYTVHAAGRVSELVYQPFVRTMHRLFCVAGSQSLDNIDRHHYGKVFQELGRLSFWQRFPGALDPDAALIRNAAAHGSWDYLCDTDEVELLDEGKNPKRLRVSVVELLARAGAFLQAGGVMFPMFVKVWRLADATEGSRSQLARRPAAVDPER